MSRSSTQRRLTVETDDSMNGYPNASYGELVTLAGSGGVAHEEPTASPARWYILFIFFVLAMLQAASWNFYAPINITINEIYGWSEATLAWLANTANIAVLVGLPIMSILIDSLGLRPAVVAAAIFCWLCTALRVLELIPFLNIGTDKVKYVAYVSMGFNGLSGTLMNFVGPVISAAWFPMHQRTASTAILAVAAPVGVALGFIIGPLVVPSEAENRVMRLHILYWVEAALATVVTLAILIYFPSKPANAPSFSALESAEKKNEVGEGYKKIFCCGKRAPRLWVLAITYSLSSGVFGGWGAVMYPNLKNFNFTEPEAGWLGALMTISGCIGGVLIGIIADKFSGKMKTFIIINFIISGLGFMYFTLFVHDFLPSNRIAIYAVAIIAGTCLVIPGPLFFELTMETIHGEIPEGSAASLLSILGTAVQILFLGVSFIPGQAVNETAWMNWLMTATFPVSIVILFFWRAEYPRLTRDKKTDFDVAYVDGIGCI